MMPGTGRCIVMQYSKMYVDSNGGSDGPDIRIDKKVKNNQYDRGNRTGSSDVLEAEKCINKIRNNGVNYQFFSFQTYKKTTVMIIESLKRSVPLGVGQKWYRGSILLIRFIRTMYTTLLFFGIRGTYSSFRSGS